MIYISVKNGRVRRWMIAQKHWAVILHENLQVLQFKKLAIEFPFGFL